MIKPHYGFVLALAVSLVAAGCAGAGTALSPLQAEGPASGTSTGAIASKRHRRVKARFVIKIHRHRRVMHPGVSNPRFISPNTASLGAVVAVGAGSPGPAQYVNVSGCPVQDDVATCTLTVAAAVGSDTFTVTAYSGQNGGGSALGSGSLVATIAPGVANVTEPLVIDGIVNAIMLSLPVSTLPLGQSQTMVVSAQDASGATIVGTYQTPVALSAPDLTFSPASLPDSATASSVGVQWKFGFGASANDTITATSGSQQGHTSLASAPGFAYYQVGDNPAYDNSSFLMTTGPDGNIYYGTFGPYVCTGPPNDETCGTNDGAIGQFNPTSHVFNEIELHSEAVEPYFTSDGALWVGGGISGNLFRFPPISATSLNFSAGAQQTIAVPTPPSGSGYQIRDMTQDGSGNLWFVDVAGGRYLSIPIGNPTSGAITAYAMPAPAAGTPGYPARSRGLAYGADGNLYVNDYLNGELDQISPSNGAVINQFVFPQTGALPAQDDCCVDLGFTYAGANGEIYTSYIGAELYGVYDGGIESLATSGLTFAALPLPTNGDALLGPWGFSIGGSTLAYSDLGNEGLGLTDLTTGGTTTLPFSLQNAGSVPLIPNDTTFAPDGSVWFTCYGNAGGALCLGHAVYLSGWSVWPSQTIQISGAGAPSSQLIGIMENPSGTSSGPFTVASDDTSVCSVTQPASPNTHNFTITGVAAGSCTVTVTDKNSVQQAISVGVTTTSGVINARHRKHQARSLL